jgi:glycosyltransferase involved in cell wall biosynthesis
MIDDYLITEGGAGIYNYTRELLAALLETDSKNEYVLIHYKKSRYNHSYERRSDFIIPIFRIPFWKEIRKTVMLPLMMRGKELDIIHEPNVLIPNLFPHDVKKILTFHDVSTFSLPWTHTRSNLFRARLSYLLGTSKFDKIIAVSEYSKLELMRYLHVSSDKIEVIYEGVNERFRPSERTGWIKTKYGICGRFILFVGTVEPRKNIQGLLMGFFKLKKKGIKQKLVIVGKKGLRYREVLETTSHLGLQGDVIFTGYVPEADLVQLYNESDMFVFPSLHEGFGLPPLEAMACGTPVVASNASSLVEVIDDAGLTVDTQNPDTLAGAMHEVLTNENLSLELAKKGLERASRFSWRATAKKTVDLYAKVVAQ